MERFLARIPDDLLIFDYQSKQKISGQEWKQDVAVAMDALASYNTIVLAEQNSYHWVVVLCACMCSGKTLHILDKSADICKICKYFYMFIIVLANLLLYNNSRSQHGGHMPWEHT